MSNGFEWVLPDADVYENRVYSDNHPVYCIFLLMFNEFLD